jgi:hypothetical protein
MDPLQQTLGIRSLKLEESQAGFRQSPENSESKLPEPMALTIIAPKILL